MGNCTSDANQTVEFIRRSSASNSTKTPTTKNKNGNETKKQNDINGNNKLFCDINYDTNKAILTSTTINGNNQNEILINGCPFKHENGDLLNSLVDLRNDADLDSPVNSNANTPKKMISGSAHSNPNSNNFKSNSIEFDNQYQRLKINDLVEAASHILFPSSALIYQAYKTIFIQLNMQELFEKENHFDIELYDQNDDENNVEVLKLEIVEKIEKYISDMKEDLKKQTYIDLLRTVGELYFVNVFKKYKQPLFSIGATLQDFYNNLNSLSSSFNKQSNLTQRVKLIKNEYMPSVRCFRNKNDLQICLFNENPDDFIKHFYYGLIKKSAELIWELEVDVELVDQKSVNNKYINEAIKEHTICFKVKLIEHTSKQSLAKNESEFQMDETSFNNIFPFTVVFNRKLDVQEIGDGFVKYIESFKGSSTLNLLALFELIEPKLDKYSFDFLLNNQNIRYKMRLKTDVSDNKTTIAGSFVYLEEYDYLLFIGSPSISSLEELNDRGMYLSDIPLYDATRDLILLNEQTKAQDGLKLRMQKLKKSITEAHKAIDEERKKNIELLNLIFPSHIARQLWMGEKIPSQRVIGVTLLYSDIVGFTSICSTAQPIEVIEMLKKLYTDFDNYCGILEIYKIETIGDAYVVAGGLHKESRDHAHRITWMGLLMIDSATKKYTHKGDRIKMRIGIHSGEVLAGIVGIKMPRYCLFGNNCTIANKFESLSEENRVHISPVTKTLIESTPGFTFEARTSDTLPEGFEKKTGDISWFVNSFKHPEISEKELLQVHVEKALKNFN